MHFLHFIIFSVAHFIPLNYQPKTVKFEVVFKEVSASTSPDDLTVKNLKYLNTINEFHTEDFLWEIAAILYNRVEFSEVQYTGGRYYTLFGDIDKRPENLVKDAYLGAGYLDQNDIKLQVEWHEKLGITDQESYDDYFSSLSNEVKAYINTHPNFPKEIQYEKISELFSFYKQAAENGNWVLLHQRF